MSIALEKSAKLGTLRDRDSEIAMEAKEKLALLVDGSGPNSTSVLARCKVKQFSCRSLRPVSYSKFSRRWHRETQQR